MASGSQTWSGNWADLPMAPRKMSRVAQVKVLEAISPACAASKMAVISKVPVTLNRIRMPISRPTSPIRVVTKAFFAASAADLFSYQKPINR